MTVHQSLPGDRGWTDMGPAKAPRPGKAGAVAVTYCGVPPGPVAVFCRTQQPYSDKELIRIIREGETHPRLLTPAQVLVAERARVDAREDLKVLEQQFAGIGVSGTYGSLDRRTPRREGSSV